MQRIPNDLRIPFFPVEYIFFQFIDNFLKFEERECLIHYVKLKISLTLSKFTFFPNLAIFRTANLNIFLNLVECNFYHFRKVNFKILKD